MEKTREVFIDNSGSISIKNLEDCATQDACDFQDHFGSDSSNSPTEDSEEHEPRHEDGSHELRLNFTKYLNDFGVATVLSPISDLAVNVAKTKISPANCSHQTDFNQRNKSSNDDSMRSGNDYSSYEKS